MAILAPRTQLVEDLVMEMNILGIDAIETQDEHLSFDHPAVKVLTLQSAKGLEFPIVFIVGVDSGVLPRPVLDVPEEERETYRQQEARLLYVGCSRAMRRLILTYDSDRPSEFLSVLTEPIWNRAKSHCSG